MTKTMFESKCELAELDNKNNGLKHEFVYVTKLRNFFKKLSRDRNTGNIIFDCLFTKFPKDKFPELFITFNKINSLDKEIKELLKISAKYMLDEIKKIDEVLASLRQDQRDNFKIDRKYTSMRIEFEEDYKNGLD